MELITLLLIAISLSFDTFAVSVSTGLMINHIQFNQASRIALILAIVQTLMPLIGWFAGSIIKEYIINFDHWIAFILLLYIGAKMIYESFKTDEEKNFNPEKLKVQITMAIATSIDALIVGVTFAFININIWLSVIIIGIITFIASMLGMLLGKNVGNKLGKRTEIIGGIILIAIGVKILIEHLSS